MNNAIKLCLIILVIISSQAAHAFSELDVSKLKALNSCEECDLSGANLSGSNFDGAEFERTSFAGVNASRATFRGVEFDFASFGYADLTNSKFEIAKGSVHIFSSDLTGAKIHANGEDRLTINASNLSNAKITNVKNLFLNAEIPEVLHLVRFKKWCQRPFAKANCEYNNKVSDAQRITKMTLDETDLSGSEISGNLTDADFSNTILRNTKISPSAILCRTKFPWGVENRNCEKSQNEKRDAGYYLDLMAKDFTSKDTATAWDKIDRDGTILNQLLVATLYEPNLEKIIPMLQAAFEQRLAQARTKRTADKVRAEEAKQTARKVAKARAEKEAEELKKFKNNMNNIGSKMGRTINHISSCWAPPIGLIGAKNMKVSVLVTVDPKGQLLTAEILNKERLATDSKFRVLADEALRAVHKCSPFPVPSIGYELWKEIEVTFDANKLDGQ